MRDCAEQQSGTGPRDTWGESMPSPLAHGIAAALIYEQERRRRGHVSRFSKPDLVLLGAAGAFSVLPDLDAVAGVLMRDFGAYHNHGTHSLAFLAGVVVCAWLVARAVAPTATGAWIRLAFLGVGCHILMDFFTVGRGLKLLWPFCQWRFIAPIRLFYGLHWSQGLWSRMHITTFATELASMVFAAAWVLRRRPGPEPSGEGRDPASTNQAGHSMGVSPATPRERLRT